MGSMPGSETAGNCGSFRAERRVWEMAAKRWGSIVGVVG